MPTLLVINGLRFSFYSNESNEPAHVHITKGGANGKIWLEPSVVIAYLHNFTNGEIRSIEAIVAEYAMAFKKKWDDYFSK